MLGGREGEQEQENVRQMERGDSAGRESEIERKKERKRQKGGRFVFN